MTVLNQIPNGASGADVRDTINSLLGTRGPRILIAAANAPASVKKRADIVCTGTDDNVLIQAALDGLPALPNYERSKVLVVGAKTGHIEFSEGQFNLSTAITVAAGFVGTIRGQGVSSWRPIDPAPLVWEGGTFFYSTDPGGKIWQFPQYTGNRTDTGVSNTIPASGLIFENIYGTAFNPATTQGNFAFNFAGMTTGIVRNTNAFADLSVNATSRIQGAFNFVAGARSDRKIVEGLNAAYFRDVGFTIDTTHFSGRQLVAAAIAGGTSPCGFQITPAQNMQLEGLHPFSCGIGAKIGGDEPLHIASIMFESLSNPILLQTATNTAISIGTATFNSDVNWTGDITNKIRVERFAGTKAGTGATTKRIRNGGTATILAGQTSVTVDPQLIAAPLNYSARSLSGATAVTVSANPTGSAMVINVGTAPGADLLVSWSATATINE